MHCLMSLHCIRGSACLKYKQTLHLCRRKRQIKQYIYIYKRAIIELKVEREMNRNIQGQEEVVAN